MADQRDDPDSLLSHYRDLIHLRNGNSALRQGDLTAVDSDVRGVYAFLRHHKGQTVLVVINLDDEPVSDYGLSLDESDLDFSRGRLIHGEGAISLPVVNEAGGFKDYAPLPALAAQSLIVIEFDSDIE